MASLGAGAKPKLKNRPEKQLYTPPETRLCTANSSEEDEYLDMYLPDTVDSPTLIRRTTSRSDVPDARLAKLVDKFEGKMGTSENWFHKFQVTVDMCRWSEASKLFMMTNALTVAALTAHRTMPDRV